MAISTSVTSGQMVGQMVSTYETPSADAGAPQHRQESPTPENQNPDAVRRKYVLKELLQTEHDYVKKMATVCEVSRKEYREIS